ncbi:hypothetical protein FRC17_008180, partial [Serendipita sp. 399]
QSAVSVDPEIIDLSDELDEDLPKVAKKLKKSEQDLVKKDKKKKKKRKDDSKVDFAQGVDEDNESAPDIALSAWKPENVTFSDDELLLKNANKEKKRSKKRKDEADYEELTTPDPSTSKRSKKRKSPEVTDMEISSLKSKKRRRIMTDPSEHDSEPAGSDNDEDIDIPRKESDAPDNVKVPASTSGEGNQAPQAYSSFNGENMQLPDNQDPSNEPKSDVDSTNSTKKDTSREVPPRQPAPRKPSENNPSTQHYIPKRGSISGLLKKTGLHAPLSSSKIVRSTSNRIAPLHLSRRTPPPPPPPIPKPKKKVEADDEDKPDFASMTQKQIDKYWEEKKKRAWYSP